MNIRHFNEKFFWISRKANVLHSMNELAAMRWQLWCEWNLIRRIPLSTAFEITLNVKSVVDNIVAGFVPVPAIEENFFLVVHAKYINDWCSRFAFIYANELFITSFASKDFSHSPHPSLHHTQYKWKNENFWRLSTVLSFASSFFFSVARNLIESVAKTDSLLIQLCWQSRIY